MDITNDARANTYVVFALIEQSKNPVKIVLLDINYLIRAKANHIHASFITEII